MVVTYNSSLIYDVFRTQNRVFSSYSSFFNESLTLGRKVLVYL